MSKKIQPSEPANHIAVFQEKTIRRVWHENAWWFSVVDVCAAGWASRAHVEIGVMHKMIGNGLCPPYELPRQGRRRYDSRYARHALPRPACRH